MFCCNTDCQPILIVTIINWNSIQVFIYFKYFIYNIYHVLLPYFIIFHFHTIRYLLLKLFPLLSLLILFLYFCKVHNALFIWRDDISLTIFVWLGHDWCTSSKRILQIYTEPHEHILFEPIQRIKLPRDKFWTTFFWFQQSSGTT